VGALLCQGFLVTFCPTKGNKRKKLQSRPKGHLSQSTRFIVIGRNLLKNPTQSNATFSIALEDDDGSKPTFRIQRWGAFEIFFSTKILLLRSKALRHCEKGGTTDEAILP
jgi:hypothetical protein